MPDALRWAWVAAILVATGLAGQSPDLPGRRLVVARVHGATDTIAVALREHGQYRVAVTPASVAIELHARASRSAAPFVVEVRTPPPGFALYEVYPRSDGAFMIVVATGGKAATVTVLEDTVAETRVAARERRRVRPGFGVSGGTESGYIDGDTLATFDAPGARPGASGYVEAVLMFRTSPHFTAEIGFGNDPRPPGYVSVSWFFGELQFGRHQWMVNAHALEVALAFRYSQGNTTAIAADRSAVSVGPMIGWHFDRGTDGRGLMLTLEPQFAYSFNPKPYQTFARVGAGLAWIP